MLYLVIDSLGKSAYIKMPNLGDQNRVLYQVEAIKEVESGKVLKTSAKGFAFNQDAPIAVPIRARTNLGLALVGTTPFTWHVGYQADNGFTVPSRKVLANYTLVPPL